MLPKYYDIVVFCHLRWHHVFQRPQQIISRLAQTKNILFVEEPIGFDDPKEEFTANIINVENNITVLQPRVKSISDIQKVLPDYILNKHVPVAWFYSGNFHALVDAFPFDKIVYDCMDELSLFKYAPVELIEQEKKLVNKAHVVFTGGKSLYEAKRGMHRFVYCFPSSVDQKHFEKALNGVAVPEDIANLPKPVIGYYGVIDERIDYELIAETAKQNPQASFVMIGPLAKVEDKDLPKAPNIHYLGMRAYTDLPAYLKGFTIAMMPFAMNDSTKYISPTKTLEYMAARKPIISTPVADVVRDYSHCVDIVKDATGFTEAIKNISACNGKEWEERSDSFGQILKETSWDSTVKKMKDLIEIE